MADDRIEISRRAVLASLGSVGLASAGAGLGTSALFSDEELFRGTAIATGELEVKLAWEEHRSNPRQIGLDEPPATLEEVRRSPNESELPLPDPTNPIAWLPDVGQEAYLNDTSVESYPDPDNDRKQNDFAAEPGETTDLGVGYICADGADLQQDRDPTGNGLRTQNPDTYVDGTPQPLLNLDDVKPGDFGEVTLQYHLCDGPGYVWLTGSLTSNSENGVTEPEEGAIGEDGTQGAPGTRGELLDAIQTRLWYDDGDNVPEVGDDGDDPGYLTPTLSLAELLSFLGSGSGIQLCPGGDSGAEITASAGNCPIEKDYDSVHETGETVTVDASGADDPTNLTIPKNPKCADFGLVQGLKTDEAGGLPESGEKSYPTPYGEITVATALVDGRQTVTDWSIDGDEGYCVAKVIVKGGNQGANVYSYDNASEGADTTDDDFTNDDVVGSLSDEDTELQTPTGQDISHVDFCLASPTSGENNGWCFEPSTDHYIGLAWWLPTDVGNEIQSDSVGFDLGFYTEQCRHNEPSAG